MAKNGFPDAMPNPSVGAVLVIDDTIIGEGYTSAYGGPHAEVNAIASVSDTSCLPKATLYVSLEPCSHYGKTPPCADLIVSSGIKRVVIGTIDPHAKVAGNGIKKLIDAGIDVTVGVLENACQEINKRFFTFHAKKRPYIILKWAQTTDGFIAPLHRNVQAPVWITNQYSRMLVHKWRSEEQAILVGAQTLLADNPSLTTRDWEGTSPTRIVLDPQQNLSRNLAVFSDDVQTFSLATEDPHTVCDLLFEKNIQSVLIEGGGKTLQRFIDSNLWDEARVFCGDTHFSEGIKAPILKNPTNYTKETIKEDILFYYKNQDF